MRVLGVRIFLAVALACASSIPFAVSQAAAAPVAVNPDTLVGVQVDTICGGGIDAVNVKLPAGFNALTATDSELAANELPLRPANPADLSTWKNFVTGKVRKQVARCDLITGPASTEKDLTRAVTSRSATNAAPAASTVPNSTPSWSGYEVYGATFSDAYAAWRVPNVGNKVPPNHSSDWSSQWVAIGRASSAATPLLQAGTEANDERPGVAPSTYYMWWQILPQQTHQTVIPPLLRIGDLVSVHIHLTHDDAVATILDETTGRGGTYTYKSGSFNSDGHAEWILERTEIYVPSDWEYPLLAYAPTVFTGVEASAPGLSLRGIGHLKVAKPITMWTCVKPVAEIAAPGAIAKNGTQFTDAWKSFGHLDLPANCKFPPTLP